MENNSNTSKIICRRLRKGIVFFAEDIRACCSNRPGPQYAYLSNINNINWDYIKSTREELIQQFLSGNIPECCVGCPDSTGKSCNIDIPENGYNNKKFDLIQINHFFACNSNCIYCVNKFEVNFKKIKNPNYKIVPILKEMENQNLIEHKLDVLFTGGEPTCLKELDNILEFLNNKDCRYHILTSGIQYKEQFEKLFSENRVLMVTALDNGCKQTYKKIKQVNKFDNVIHNIQKYIQKVPIAADQIVLKYILLESYNDNKEEIKNFINIAAKLGIKKLEPAIDYSKKYADVSYPVPEKFYELFAFFKDYAHKLGFEIILTPRIEMIITQGKVT